HVLSVLAFRITAARQERSAPAFAQDHRLAAFLADMFGGSAGRHGFALGVEVHGRHALRVAAASQERPARSHALKHRLAALWADVLGGHGRFPALIAFARFGVSAIRIATASPEGA